MRQLRPILHDEGHFMDGEEARIRLRAALVLALQAKFLDVAVLGELGKFKLAAMSTCSTPIVTRALTKEEVGALLPGLGMICAGRTMRMCVEESSTTVWDIMVPVDGRRRGTRISDHMSSNACSGVLRVLPQDHGNDDPDTLYDAQGHHGIGEDIPGVQRTTTSSCFALLLRSFNAFYYNACALRKQEKSLDFVQAGQREDIHRSARAAAPSSSSRAMSRRAMSLAASSAARYCSR